MKIETEHEYETVPGHKLTVSDPTLKPTNFRILTDLAGQRKECSDQPSPINPIVINIKPTTIQVI